MQVLKRSNRFTIPRALQRQVRVYQQGVAGKRMPRYLLKCGCCDEKVRDLLGTMAWRLMNEWAPSKIGVTLVPVASDRAAWGAVHRSAQIKVSGQQDASVDARAPHG